MKIVTVPIVFGHAVAVITLGTASALSLAHKSLGETIRPVKIRSLLVARRQRKAHQRHLAERVRQEALQGRDAQDSVRDVARGSAGAQQGMYGQN